MEARETFRLLLGEGLDEAEAGDLIKTAGPLFACAAYAAAEMGEPEQAFALACEGKARLIATALRLQRLDLPPEESQRLDTLRTAIREESRLIGQVDSLKRAEALDHLAALRQELAGLIALSEQRAARPDAITQAHRICADGSVIVAPVVTGAGGKLILVTRPLDRVKGSPTIIELPELTSERMTVLMQADASTNPEGWLGSFARDIAEPDRKERLVRGVEQIGHTLWTLLVEPMEKALAEQGVAPDARLVFLPSAGFGLLPLGLAQAPSSNQRLIERREIAYAPSLDAIDRAAAFERGKRAVRSLAAIINPTGDLIHAPLEGAFVADHFDKPTILDAKDATAANVLASLKGKSHWHFSTHGLFDLQDARQSALAMKDGERLSVGSLLEADDLGRPRLVVLSACETGLHDVLQAPEEFIGFPGAFMSLGAKAVLGTLWPVDDRASALLTARFYDEHIKDGRAPGAALRRAQLWLQSATAADLDSYMQKAAASGHPAANTDVAVLEQARFFAFATPHKPVTDKPLPAAGRKEADEPARPFAHPVFWGGFIITGQ